MKMVDSLSVSLTFLPLLSIFIGWTIRDKKKSKLFARVCCVMLRVHFVVCIANNTIIWLNVEKSIVWLETILRRRFRLKRAYLDGMSLI